MGLLDIFRRRAAPAAAEQTPEEITPPVSAALLRAIFDNEIVTRETALALPPVSGAVDFICSAIASMPVKLYKHIDNKVVEQSEDSRVRLLNGDTGDTLDAYQLKKALVEDYLLGTGGYCYIQRYRNEVTGLYYVENIYVTVEKNYKPIYKDYFVYVEGQRYNPWDFIKLLRNTKDGAIGTGVTEQLTQALQTAYQTLLYQLRLARSGGAKKGFLKSERKLGKPEIDELKAAWKNLYENDSENVVVLNNGLDFKEASASSVEMQINESKKTFSDEVNNIFHIYPNDFNRTFKEGIYPIVKAFETALNRDLLLEKEKGKKFFEFDVKEIVKAALKERYEAYKLAKETGFVTTNEIRRAENMEWIEGLDVVNVGLGAVLYDVNTHKYYTPNTDTTGDPNDLVNAGSETSPSPTQEEIQKLIEDKEIDTAFEQSGNSSEG